MDIVQLVLKRFAPSVQVPFASIKKCEWGLRKKCFLLLYSNSKSLSEHHEKLVHLMEIRKKQVNSEKRAGLDVSSNSESETGYRTAFLRVVIGGLEMMRWPGATAAFSDPLNDLLFDEEVFRQAITYIYLNYFGDIPKDDDIDEGKEDSRTFRYPDSPKSLFESSNYSEVQFEGQSSSAGDRVKDRNSNNDIFDVADQSWNDVSMIREAEYKNDDAADMIEEDGNSNKYVRTIRMLQSQNSALQASLKSIHDSVNMRENAERRMEAILIDLVQAVDEMVSLSGGDPNNTNNTHKMQTGGRMDKSDNIQDLLSDKDSSFITTEEDDEFQKEVDREKRAKATGGDPRRRVVSPSKDRRTGAVTGGKSTQVGDRKTTESAIIWTATSKRLTNLSKEWDAARKSAKIAYIKNLVDVRREKRETRDLKRGGR